MVWCGSVHFDLVWFGLAGFLVLETELEPIALSYIPELFYFILTITKLSRLGSFAVLLQSSRVLE